ncbi:MAG TPA: hypothetical protein VIK72_03565 [Clostridiaceae bacterium]
MIKLTLLEMLLRGIPEAFIFIWATYILSKTKFNSKRWFISGLTLGIAGYFIRLLPISLGINSILSIILMIVLSILISKMTFKTAVSVCMAVMVIEFISEFLNMILIQYVLKLDIKYIMNNLELKLIWTLPSLIFTCLIIISIYYIGKRRKIISI